MIFSILLAACGGNIVTDPLHTYDDHGARHSAQQYYQLLIDHKTQDYVKALAGSDTMDSAMYKQMCDLMDQYLAHEQEVHQGLQSATVTGDSLNNQDSTATTFLDVTYGDNTTEHISLPLRFKNSTWRIK